MSSATSLGLSLKPGPVQRFNPRGAAPGRAASSVVCAAKKKADDAPSKLKSSLVTAGGLVRRAGALDVPSGGRSSGGKRT